MGAKLCGLGVVASVASNQGSERANGRGWRWGGLGCEQPRVRAGELLGMVLGWPRLRATKGPSGGTAGYGVGVASVASNQGSERAKPEGIKKSVKPARESPI